MFKKLTLFIIIMNISISTPLCLSPISSNSLRIVKDVEILDIIQKEDVNFKINFKIFEFRKTLLFLLSKISFQKFKKVIFLYDAPEHWWVTNSTSYNDDLLFRHTNETKTISIHQYSVIENEDKIANIEIRIDLIDKIILFKTVINQSHEIETYSKLIYGFLQILFQSLKLFNFDVRGNIYSSTTSVLGNPIYTLNDKVINNSKIESFFVKINYKPKSLEQLNSSS